MGREQDGIVRDWLLLRVAISSHTPLASKPRAPVIEHTSKGVTFFAENEGHVMNVPAAPLCRWPVPVHVTCKSQRNVHDGTQAL